ncbi:N-terminal Xaa-Pro-Lys N-methyltransferase 1-like [Plodia interpunctella]|uniref:N-terminal Xaa-Pro-Lys N-methyltransferase 1-like n=1 Tax=Plodia interpunctella TaxID=58824 RepID=UPI0023679731|nr:N-terminal Xaa-Pro-Lys N-methyltransferase 1-like [Plodia interpunctella]
MTFNVTQKMSESSFYKRAASYWANVPATIDGVLGGFGHISDIDIEGSKAFLQNIFTSKNPPGRQHALDCGAGIGRISKNLLIPIFDKVDLVEQDEKFIDTAKMLIGENNSHLGTMYKIGLQDFKPQKLYDVIWCQWVLGHLNDFDLINFFERCSDALTRDGVIIVKENITTTDEVDYDENDSSITRPYELIKQIIEEASLKILKTDIQLGFPDDIYPVHMFALAPMEPSNIEIV